MPALRGIIPPIVMAISSTVYSTGRHSSRVLKGLKCALALEGVCDDFMAEPFHRFRDPERRRIRQYVALVKRQLAEVEP